MKTFKYLRICRAGLMVGLLLNVLTAHIWHLPHDICDNDGVIFDVCCTTGQPGHSVDGVRVVVSGNIADGASAADHCPICHIVKMPLLQNATQTVLRQTFPASEYREGGYRNPAVPTLKTSSQARAPPSRVI